MNTNDFYELKKSYDTSQMPEKEVIKMKEKMNQWRFRLRLQGNM